MQEELMQNVENNLKNNEYPGRGIIIGSNASGSKLIQVYWIMGRSANSRNRIFVLDNNVVKTKAYDESKIQDPTNIIYNALKQLDDCYIVSNGIQTDTIYDALQSNGTFESALATRKHETDEPNYTPRISGLILFSPENPAYKLNILKAINNDPDKPENRTWDYTEFINGAGHCIHTYKENGNPLPPFEGSPYMVPVQETIDEIAGFYWNNLNESNRISIAVKSIEKGTGEIEYKIINKHQQ